MSAHKITKATYLDIKSQLIEASSGLEELFIHMQDFSKHETLTGGEIRLVGRAVAAWLNEAQTAFSKLLDLYFQKGSSPGRSIKQCDCACRE